MIRMLAFLSHTIFGFEYYFYAVATPSPSILCFKRNARGGVRSQRCLTRSSSLHSKSYLYGIAFSRPACLFYLGAVIDPLHGKKIKRIVGCAWNVDALIVRNFREKHWENMLQRGNTIHRRESCRREKVAILENSQSPSVVQTGWLRSVWLKNALFKHINSYLTNL